MIEQGSGVASPSWVMTARLLTRRRPGLFRADPVVLAPGEPSSLPDGRGRKEVPMKRFEVYEMTDPS